MPHMSPKEQLEMLMNELMPFAEQCLNEWGEFYPFGGMLYMDGELAHVGAKIEGDDQPPSKELIDVLVDGHQKLVELGEIKASAAIFRVDVNDPQTGEKTEAVQCNLDHLDGISAEVFHPYQLVNGIAVWDSIFAQEGKYQIFSRERN